MGERRLKLINIEDFVGYGISLEMSINLNKKDVRENFLWFYKYCRYFRDSFSRRRFLV